MGVATKKKPGTEKVLVGTRLIANYTTGPVQDGYGRREMVRTKLQLLYLAHLAVLYPGHARVAAWLAHLIWEAEGDVYER